MIWSYSRWYKHFRKRGLSTKRAKYLATERYVRKVMAEQGISVQVIERMLNW